MPVRRACGLAEASQRRDSRQKGRMKEGYARSGGGSDGGLTLEHDDTVGEVGGHDEVVLDDEGGLLCVQDEALDDLAGNNTLFGIQETEIV